MNEILDLKEEPIKMNYCIVKCIVRKTFYFAIEIIQDVN